MNTLRERGSLQRAAVVVILLAMISGCSSGADELVGWLETAADHPLSPLLVIGVFIASGFVAAPLSVVMIPTIVIYGPVFGSLWTVIGASLAGGLFFWLGSRGADLADRFRGKTADRSRIGDLMERNGIVAVAIARNLPLGPYPLVNLALGASPVSLPQFLVGNAIGLTPWILVYAITGSEVKALLSNPSPEAWMRLGLTLVVVVFVAILVSRRIGGRLALGGREGRDQRRTRPS
jgi:phospholipase D1/2